jgi:predicted dehydrogenase
MTSTVRVGVIGTGVGVAHIEALRQVPGVEVAAVCSARAARAQEIAVRFGIPLATADYREVLAADVDAVVVATPPALHLAMGLDALAAGKHLFCEKPLALNLDEARTLRDAAHAAGVIHMLNHQQRFAAPFARAKELVDQGMLGQLALADARISTNPIGYLRSPGWSDSKAGWFTDAGQLGGLMVGSAGPHLVDLLLWYGGPIAEVATRTAVSRAEIPLADGQVLRGVSGEDTFLTLARFTSGGLATIRGVPIAYQGGGGFALELQGTGGGLIVERGTLRAATASEREPAQITLPADAPQDRVGIARRFIEAIQSGGPSPAPTFDDGVAVQAVLDACLVAARTNGWVTIAAN